MRPPRRTLRYQRLVLGLAVLAIVPGAAATLVLLWTGNHAPGIRWGVSVAVLVTSSILAWLLHDRAVRPLQTVANLLHGLRQGDFSTRGVGAREDDALGLVITEVNSLATMLREQRIGALEATALLRTVMSEIDVAVFAFDQEERLRLVNRAGEQLLARPAARVLGLSATELSLEPLLRSDGPSTLEYAFPGGSGRWDVRRGRFRQGGTPHELLVVADLSRALREEERQVWQRLIRVLSHEINNSLAPIQSIAGSLADLVRTDQRPDDWEEDVRQGLEVVQGRSAALARFMASYARLARLPPPSPQPLAVREWVRRIAGLEPRLQVRVIEGEPVEIQADGDQLDQLLINLVRNAADAALSTGGGVEIGWRTRNGKLEVLVRDEGPGLANPANLFVPFFTTKPNGSGIGLVLSRRIAEAHGGTLTLRNRESSPGCEAQLILPLG
jgi:two-component system, NtrC family, nitrogen regulation sensor histidine kinase NtrY